MRDGALLLGQAATRAEPGSLPNWNSVSSLHIRCRMTTCWTMWQSLACLGRRWRARINPEHDPDDILGHLNALDQQTNDLALGGPIRGRQMVAHQRGEQVQFAD